MRKYPKTKDNSHPTALETQQPLAHYQLSLTFHTRPTIRKTHLTFGDVAFLPNYKKLSRTFLKYFYL
jgi:hypothetical protein